MLGVLGERSRSVRIADGFVWHCRRGQLFPQTVQSSNGISHYLCIFISLSIASPTHTLLSSSCFILPAMFVRHVHHSHHHWVYPALLSHPRTLFLISLSFHGTHTQQCLIRLPIISLRSLDSSGFLPVPSPFIYRCLQVSSITDLSRTARAFAVWHLYCFLVFSRVSCFHFRGVPLCLTVRIPYVRMIDQKRTY